MPPASQLRDPVASDNAVWVLSNQLLGKRGSTVHERKAKREDCGWTDPVLGRGPSGRVSFTARSRQPRCP